jgi:hypothetical protein
VLVDRGDRDDPSGRPRGDHPLRRGLGAGDRAQDVDADRLLDVLQRRLQERPRVAAAGVVDEHVEPAERVGQLVDDAGGRGRVAEVEPAHFGTASGGAHLLGGPGRPVLVGAPHDADVVAGLGERHGGGAPDSGV